MVDPADSWRLHLLMLYHILIVLSMSAAPAKAYSSTFHCSSSSRSVSCSRRQCHDRAGCAIDSRPGRRLDATAPQHIAGGGDEVDHWRDAEIRVR